MLIQGYFDLRFEPVREAFATLFASGRQQGAALCVRIGGETVIDLWAGFADARAERVWESDTLVGIYSCSKTFAAVAALQLVAEGRLGLDEPIARLWPEFVQAGKAPITLRQLLCHRAGIPALRQALPAEALYDWPRMCAAIASESPWWPAGEAQGYAPLTYGWILGELIQRADGRSAGEAIVARVARPHGLDFHLGLGDAEIARLAQVQRGRNDFGDEYAQRLMKAVQGEPESVSGRAFNNPPGALAQGNRPEWWRLAQPAASGHATARGLAEFYAALIAGQLLDPALVAEMRRQHSLDEDVALRAPTRFGLGCWLERADVPAASFGMGEQAFGHPGAGGSLGFADPERELAFGFVTNTLGPYVLMDPRAQMLSRAVAACLG